LKLAEAGVGENDLLLVRDLGPSSASATGSASQPTFSGLRWEDIPVSFRLFKIHGLPRFQAGTDPVRLREIILANSHLLRELEHTNPPMAAAIKDEDPTKLRELLLKVILLYRNLQLTNWF
jgi:hypothetical protein